MLSTVLFIVQDKKKTKQKYLKNKGHLIMSSFVRYHRGGESIPVRRSDLIVLGEAPIEISVLLSEDGTSVLTPESSSEENRTKFVTENESLS